MKLSTSISGDHSKVKIPKYMGFCVYRRSYLTWSPVIAPSPLSGKRAALKNDRTPPVRSRPCLLRVRTQVCYFCKRTVRKTPQLRDRACWSKLIPTTRSHDMLLGCVWYFNQSACVHSHCTFFFYRSTSSTTSVCADPSNPIIKRYSSCTWPPTYDTEVLHRYACSTWWSRLDSLQSMFIVLNTAGTACTLYKREETRKKQRKTSWKE